MSTCTSISPRGVHVGRMIPHDRLTAGPSTDPGNLSNLCQSSPSLPMIAPSYVQPQVLQYQSGPVAGNQGAALGGPHPKVGDIRIPQHQGAHAPFAQPLLQSEHDQVGIIGNIQHHLNAAPLHNMSYNTASSVPAVLRTGTYQADSRVKTEPNYYMNDIPPQHQVAGFPVPVEPNGGAAYLPARTVDPLREHTSSSFLAARPIPPLYNDPNHFPDAYNANYVSNPQVVHARVQGDPLAYVPDSRHEHPPVHSVLGPPIAPVTTAVIPSYSSHSIPGEVDPVGALRTVEESLPVIPAIQPARMDPAGMTPLPNPADHGNTVSHDYSNLHPSVMDLAASVALPIQQQQLIVDHHRNEYMGLANGTANNPVGNVRLLRAPVYPPTPAPALTPFDTHMNMGYSFRHTGRQDLAVEHFRNAACLRPDSSEARSCFALACHEQGLYDTAITEFTVALQLGAAYAEDVYNNMGNTFRAMGRSADAEVAYRAALNISPRHAHAWNNLGNAMRAQGSLDEAMSCYTASLSAQPGFAPAHCNFAGLLRDQGKPQEAEVQYRTALMSDPDLAEAAAGLGTALRDMGRAEEAISYYIRAVRLQPSGADHHANLANTYKDLNRIEDSILSYQSALDLQRDMPDAFCNMVHSLCVICDWRNRKENFASLLAIIDKQLEALLRLPSTHPRLYNSLVGALTNSTPHLVNVNGGSRSERDSTLSRGEDSADYRRKRTRVRHPSSPISSTRSTGTSQRIAESSVNPPSTVTYPSRPAKPAFSAPEAAVVAPVHATGLPSVQPFHALIYPMSPEKFKALSAAYASRAEALVEGVPHATQCWTRPRDTGGRLKVGYVSSDYNNHPYSHLTQSVYGLHRGANVECFCYALTRSDGSAWRHRIETEAENFRDISGMNAQLSAQTIANDGIHVLVNCNGYTKGARTELFALRPAPVQVSFMGFAGTLGAHYIEYFITDKVTSPPRLSARMHSECLLYHPHSYFVNDHKQTSIAGPRNYPGAPLTRARYGLPEDCFLFIMHNQVYKIDPETFDVWARILKRVPHSKLWLLRFPPSAESRIREEALARGVPNDRIIFTDVATKEEHVARCGLGDLFLDTPTCNAHTTGTDALWSGIPLVTCPGSLFASRVAASLLQAAGLPELIADDMKAYEELAVDLATNPAKLAGIRERLESSRKTNPLFDTVRWVRNVELLYWQAWHKFESGQEPSHIFGVDIYEAQLRGSSAAAGPSWGAVAPVAQEASASSLARGHGSLTPS